jgi:hypothetical protein
MIQLEFTSVAEIQGTVNVYQDILIKVRGAAIRAIFLVEIVRKEMEIIVILKKISFQKINFFHFNRLLRLLRNNKKLRKKW